MRMYELPKLELPKLKKPQFWQNKNIWLIIFVIFISSVFGFFAGIISGSFFYAEIRNYLNKLQINLSENNVAEKEIIKEYIPQTPQEEAVIKVVNESSPAVVSIVITKDVPIIEQYFFNPFGEEWPFFEFQIPGYRQKGTEKREIGGGTAFFISEDGMLLTNAHVVSDKEAEYTVLTNEMKKYPATVLARDTVRDLAIIKVEGGPFPTLKLGDSDNLQIGQTVIAIGNALGEFRNTVSVGIISGLGRNVTAGDEGGKWETLEDIIQTDAAINRGNSGGPLLNLKGEVIGVNFAMAQQAENIGFAIPINQAKKDIEQVKKFGKITVPYLGIWYWIINEELQKEKNLPSNYGAWITRWSKDQYGRWYLRDEPAVLPKTAAAKAGLKENDIILEWNGEKITVENTLAKIIMKYSPGDKVILKILRDGKEKIVEVILGEKSE